MASILNRTVVSVRCFTFARFPTLKIYPWGSDESGQWLMKMALIYTTVIPSSNVCGTMLSKRRLDVVLATSSPGSSQTKHLCPAADCAEQLPYSLFGLAALAPLLRTTMSPQAGEQVPMEDPTATLPLWICTSSSGYANMNVKDLPCGGVGNFSRCGDAGVDDMALTVLNSNIPISLCFGILR